MRRKGTRGEIKSGKWNVKVVYHDLKVRRRDGENTRYANIHGLGHGKMMLIHFFYIIYIYTYYTYVYIYT